MFEVAELGHKLDRQAFNEKQPAVREALLDAQFRLREANFSVAVVVAGAEGSGKGDLVNLLLEWLDARGVSTHAMGEPTQEETERARFYRFWRRLPATGTTAIFLGSWYTQPIVDHALGNLTDEELDAALHKIADFERMLTHENTLLLKYWLHVTKKHQKRRFEKLAADQDTAWRVTERDWKFHKTYDEFIETSGRAIRLTSKGHAPWQLVESHDRRYRDMFVAEHLLNAIETRLNQPPPSQSARIPPQSPQGPRNIINTLDLSQSLERKRYRE
ncbi:MAG: hypothetical protein N2C14_24080, partial [Planctomycetales bacterium]